MIVLVLTFALLFAAPFAPGAFAAQGGSVFVRPSPADGPPTEWLRGRVFDAANGAALPRARVIVRAAAGRYEPVFADDRGRFEVASPASGAFTLHVSKAGYANAYASPPAGPSGDLQVGLLRGAAILGRVLDQSGSPAVAAAVSARRVGGGPEAPVQFLVQADDRGEYRIGGLPAGRYSVVVSGGQSAVPARPLEALMTAVSPDRAALLPFDVESGTVPVQTQRDAREVILRPGEEAAGVDLMRRADPRSSGAGCFVRVTASVGWAAGRASVLGRVLDTAGRPFPCAFVELIRDAAFRRSVITDSQGRFTIDTLPAGSYRLQANPLFDPASALPIVLTYSTAPLTIELRAGERRDDVRVIASRGSTVAGAVTDEYGEPVQGAQVQALLLRRQPHGGASAQSVATGVTDDRGMFRLFGLALGTYVLAASAGADVAYAGSPGQHRGYVPVYYPGTGSVRGASRLQIDADRHLQGIDLTLRVSPLARVSGQAFNSQGQPLVGAVFLSPPERSGAPALPPRQAFIDAEGRFEIAGVPPGDYILKAAGGTIVTLPNPVTPGPSELAREYVSVGEADPAPVVLQASPGSIIEGRLVEEAPAGTPRARITLARLPASGDDLPPMSARFGDTPSIYTDGTFRIPGLFGPVRITATLSDDWYLKAVVVEGVDVTDRPYDFGYRGERFEHAEIVVSNAGASISGRLVEEGNRPATGERSVLVFSMYRDHWFPGSRHLKLQASAADGTFTIGGLPPGDFLVVALDRLEADVRAAGWDDPEVLEVLSPQAQRLSLREGERASITLRIR